MIFEVQIPYPLKETEGREFDGSYMVEHWLSRSLKKHRGSLVEFSATSGDSSLLVEFDDLEDAKSFNCDLHKFFAPRMYLDTETDSDDRFLYLDPEI